MSGATQTQTWRLRDRLQSVRRVVDEDSAATTGSLGAFTRQKKQRAPGAAGLQRPGSTAYRVPGPRGGGRYGDDADGPAARLRLTALNRHQADPSKRNTGISSALYFADDAFSIQRRLSSAQGFYDELVLSLRRLRVVPRCHRSIRHAESCVKRFAYRPSMTPRRRRLVQLLGSGRRDHSTGGAGRGRRRSRRGTLRSRRRS